MGAGGIRGFSNIPLLPVLPGASTVRGFVTSTNIGDIVTRTSNKGVLAVGTTADVSDLLGFVAAVPNNTTPGSTVPFYVLPFSNRDEVEVKYSTLYSTGHPATTDIGKYIGFGNTSTPAGALLDVSSLADSPGTTSGCWLRVNGFSTNRRMIFGVPHSTHILR